MKLKYLLSLVVILSFLTGCSSSNDDGVLQGESEDNVKYAAKEKVDGSMFKASLTFAENKPFAADACIHMGDEDKALDCFKKYFKDLVLEQSPSLAFQELQQLSRQNVSVTKTHCYDLTKSIGEAAMEKYSNEEERVAYGDAMCGGGYFEVVMKTKPAVLPTASTTTSETTTTESTTETAPPTPGA